MFVPEGFQVEVIASEPEIHQPVAFAWDERGRIWVAEAYSYPTKRPPGEGQDQLVILSDEDGDGRFESRKIFARGLNLVSGFEVGHGGVWVGAAPELLFIRDANHDDIPDGPPEVLLDGFGYQDTHECLNSFLWGPDGWLYGIQGVFNLAHIGRPGAPDSERQELRAGVWRYHPVRRTFEVFAHGGSNPWGLDYDEHGQLFMTHCRSYWGRGGTTHVIQGGEFWNQANANYAPWIIANPPTGYPEFRNFMLASARYDHGAGGAGAPGSDAIYGGHSHVGTLIYQGDNWPEEYRGHLFTHNLHGHQINHQVNLRDGSGFNTVHGGRDMLFCTDPAYVAVDLQTGPDGAVYFIDWYDTQHCHNPNTERWDRSNGRLYRMSYAATYHPVSVNLATMGDRDLVGLLTHSNAWYSRMAQRLLAERSAFRGSVDLEARRSAQSLAASGKTAALRLRGLWTIRDLVPISELPWTNVLADPDEFVRAWGVQLAVENGAPAPEVMASLQRLAIQDPSPLVRLYLASAAQRLPDSSAWPLIEALASHREDQSDRNLPPLLWTAIARRMPTGTSRAITLARANPTGPLADWIHWYAAVLGGDSLEQSVDSISKANGDLLRRRLAGLWLAVEPQSSVPPPPSWNALAPRLYASSDPQVIRHSQSLGAAFGDTTAFPALRSVLSDPKQSPEQRAHAFSVLGRTADPGSLAVFLGLLGEPSWRLQAIRVLSRFDSPDVSAALLKQYADYSPTERAAVLDALTRRPGYALALLDAVAAGSIRRDQLTSLQMRQLESLRNPEINRRIAASWGRTQPSPAEKLDQIAKLQKAFEEAPLWAYDGRAGRQHFQKLCASCHVLGQDGNRIGPELTGSNANGIRYFLENIIDPDAVIGADFELLTVETKSGDLVSGLLIQETGSALTLRTPTEQRVIGKEDVARRERSDRSLMPSGLLDSLNPREQIELLKFLTAR
ncbi:MAG: PVC-type heme-binding CxxCH protein [Verrucomicrobiota bacterium]